jgi:hypothetical protein
MDKKALTDIDARLDKAFAERDKRISALEDRVAALEVHQSSGK